jgi:hypothetical protein
MMGSLYRAIFERRCNRDRRRRIAKMLEGERAGNVAVLDWVEAMAAQLAEIRTLPEAPDVRR